MNGGFTKLFASIVGSTIWQEKNETRVVWITMLALADRSGIVGASVPGLANFARVSLPECLCALEVLSAPDPYSRTPDNEGRRIEKVDGGWRLLNHAIYREMLPNERKGNAEEQFGKIYFIACGGLIKIGFSKNPWARLAALKTGNPENPVLLGYFSGTLRNELDLQQQFDGVRENREWYRDCSEIRSYIEQMVANGSWIPATKVATDKLPETTGNYKSEAETEAKAETKKKKTSPRPTGGEAKESNPDHALFIKLWTEQYPDHHAGEKYAFQGGKDGKAVSALLSTSGKTPDELMRVAVAAWKEPDGFNLKMAASISGFNSKLNEIRSDLNAKRAEKKNGRTPHVQPEHYPEEAL